MKAGSQRRGVSLVEMLIVMAIIGMLMQLVLPAIGSAQEAARKVTCANNLRQIGLASQLHESDHGYLPTGGWGWKWIGDPDRGSGKNQPGSWAYQLLPYLEAQGVHDIGAGLPLHEKRDAGSELAATPVSIFYCPSRRLPRSTDTNRAVNPEWFNAEVPEKLSRLDYAANVGDLYLVWEGGPSPEEVDSGAPEFYKFHAAEDIGTLYTLKDVTGVIVQRHPFAYRQITDGLSFTYLFGEKRLVRRRYGQTNNDDQSAWSGDDLDTVCGVQWPPSRDVGQSAPPAEQRQWTFGSAHTQGMHMVLCDGSVHFTAYDIDPEVHRHLGTRKESEAL